MKNLVSLQRHSGAAIIVALFVVALVAAMSVMMAVRLQMDVRRTELILNASKAYFYAEGSLAWAKDQLNTNWQQKKDNQVIDRTPIVFPPQTINRIVVQSTIEDAESYFNVNNLVDPQYQAIFMRLLQKANPLLDAARAQALTLAVFHWISPEAPNPELDEYYLKANPAYRAPHRLMGHISELRLVKGFDAEVMQKIAPYVIALPKATPISINNTAPLILMSLSPGMSLETARSLAKTSQANPFGSVQAFMNQDIVKNNPIESSKITVTSSYFLLKTNVKVEQQVMTFYSLLERSEADRTVNTSLVWQSKGVQ